MFTLRSHFIADMFNSRVPSCLGAFTIQAGCNQGAGHACKLLLPFALVLAFLSRLERHRLDESLNRVLHQARPSPGEHPDLQVD